MKTLKYIFTLVIAIQFLSCTIDKEKQITNVTDYNQFLELEGNDTYNLAKTEEAFWSTKLQKSPTQYPYLSKIASANNAMFSSKGSIEYLITAEEKLIQLNKKTNYNNAANLRALTRNYISQHRFNEALELLLKAEKNGENLKATHKMLFDVHLELGNYKQAEQYLSEFKNFSDFDYLIRLSKWSDHKGDLASAINFMEKATEFAEMSNNKDLKIWSYTNLADFYGHNNQIQKSYNYYLKSLELQPNNAYAKKGIAWIVYSYEKNPKEALRILDAIMEQHKSPDYFLLKAEIAEFMGNEVEKDKNIQQYIASSSNSLYGEMYNQHNAKLYLEDVNKQEEALVLIEREIKNRATPQSYDLLAWAHYKKGAYKKALEVSENHVLNKTFEPEAQYHLAEIYKANGLSEKALEIKMDLLESAYELGPLTTEQIQKI
ncbi:cell surface protein [Tenacibaculum todarodis]|uniref:Cell surface protein n=1 Tax=Tenacibaculum todarodis TaxID=1850252 RepID=A0A1L3JG23_9FLAO|nr:hypothetical protein [Tenacibaculum todarodis]APG64064.1 cell surface protein [Tenacibaculum todarodis]